MDRKDMLVDIFKRPGLCGLRGSYREYVAFLVGFLMVKKVVVSRSSKWIAREKLGYPDNIAWESQAEIIYCARDGIEREDMIEE